MITNMIANSLVRRAQMMGLAVVAGGGFYVYDQYDKRTNYIPVQARVTEVRDMCYLEKKIGRRRQSSDEMTCAKAEAAKASDSYWAGATVYRSITLSYEYISPADKKTHRDDHVFSSYPGGKPVSRGQLINVRASKTDPEATREL